MKTVTFFGVLILASILVNGTFALAADAEKLSPPAQRLATMKQWELEKTFYLAESPQSIPNGLAIGTHVIAFETTAQVPTALIFTTMSLWDGKKFDAGNKILMDRVAGKFLGTKAGLSLGSIRDVLQARGYSNPELNATDGRVSLITDYSQTEYRGLQALLNNDTKGWIDEFREVEPGIWLGKSFYEGKFWAYVILQFLNQ